MSRVEYENTIAFHPGYYIADVLADLNLTHDELATELGLTPDDLTKLIDGETSLAYEVAENLSALLGTSVSVWLSLQKTYDEKLMEIKRHQ